MIGHEAVGMDREVARCGGFAEDLEYAIGKVSVAEIGATLPAAERYEHGDMTTIVFEGKTDGLPGGH